MFILLTEKAKTFDPFLLRDGGENNLQNVRHPQPQTGLKAAALENRGVSPAGPNLGRILFTARYGQQYSYFKLFIILCSQLSYNVTGRLFYRAIKKIIMLPSE